MNSDQLRVYKEKLGKRKEELKNSIAEKKKIIAEKDKLIEEMNQFGLKYGLKGKEKAQAFKDFKAGKFKPSKQTPEQIKYNDILNNPKISDKAKNVLRRGTKEGTKLNLKDLEGFEAAELMMSENWDSDEEEEPKKAPPKKAPPKKAKEVKEPKKTKKQLALEAKEERDAKERDMLEKEAMEKQLLMLKKFNPAEYERVMNMNKPKPEVKAPVKPKPVKRINVDKYTEGKKELEDKYEANEKLMKSKHKELLKSQKTISTDKDLGKIMKGYSELLKKNNKYSVETELNVKKGLNKMVKSALKKSVLTELNKAMEGSGLGSYDSDSDSDSDELKNYSHVIKHLLKHLEDPKEKPDKKDYKDIKRLVNIMQSVKRKRGRPKKY